MEYEFNSAMAAYAAAEVYTLDGYEVTAPVSRDGGVTYFITVTE